MADLRLKQGSGSQQAKVREHLSTRIKDGSLVPGSFLPPLRQLAAEMGVGVTPLQRALRELADIGLVEIRHGSGIRIADDMPALPSSSADIVIVARIGERYDRNRWKHRIVTALEQELVSAGHRVQFFNQVRPDGSLADLPTMIQESLTPEKAGKSFDGIAFVEASADASSREAIGDLLLRRNCLHVWIANAAHSGPFNSVYYDSDWAGFLAAEHLCLAGHRTLAMTLLRPADWGDVVARGGAQGWITERYDGVRRACRRYGATLIPVVIKPTDIACRETPNALEGDRFWEIVAEQSASFLIDALKQGATAVLTLNDLMALSLLPLIRQSGWQVPEDVSVIGFDNLDESLSANLTTLEPPIETLGREAGRLLDRLYRESRQQAGAAVASVPAQHILARPTLVRRLSVSSPPSAALPSQPRRPAYDRGAAGETTTDAPLSSGETGNIHCRSMKP